MGQLGPDGKEMPPPLVTPTKSSKPSGPDLKRRAEALKKLKKRIDGVIKDLDGSAAAKHKSAKRATRASFSGDATLFFEAEDLFNKYTEVHDTLARLSQSLRDQIDAMSIAVKYADGGLDAIEEDERHRFWKIQADSEELAKRYGNGQHGDGEEGDKKGDGGPAGDKPRSDDDRTSF
jgi:hypothetical protein